MIKVRISQILNEAFREAKARDLLPPVEPPDPGVERPQNPEHGDYASALPLKMARAARMNPLKIGETLIEFLTESEEFSKVEVVPPGFINFTLDPSWLRQQVDSILEAGERFGDIDLGKGDRVQVEFVSVNPTGPIHVGHGRGAILGSSLANILAAAGYEAQREYYVNDGGAQMEAFYRSLWARYLQALGHEAEMPSEGYFGAYMVELGQELADEMGDLYLRTPETEGLRQLGEVGMERVLAGIREDLDRLRVAFDNWFSERSLYNDGTYEHALQILGEQGYTAEKEGALWFTSTALGEEKDNVLVRQTGVPTYFASDVAYHFDKFHRRRFDRVVNVWGADHQGHVPRMKAVVRALDVDPSRLQFIIVQLVTLRRGDEIVRVSKRTGEIITLRDLLDEVGPDACRYFFLARSAEAQMDFDLELAVRQAPDNPVYYIQYAHARIASILRAASEQGLSLTEGDVSLLTEEVEQELIRRMLRLPEVIETAALALAPHHLPHYTYDLAVAFHDFYTRCRVLGVEPPLTAARLKLVLAVQTVLQKSLRLMGMEAPDHM